MSNGFACEMDVVQAFNFSKNQSVPMGYVTQLKIGDIEFAADFQSMKDPENPDSAIAGVVGVLKDISTDLSRTSTIDMTVQVSVKNQEALASKLFGTLSSVEVEMKFDVYKYDPREKKYYKALTSDAALKGVLEKNGSHLNVQVADAPSPEVQSPINMAVHLAVKPLPEEQTINVAASSQAKAVIPWGSANP